MSGGIPLRWSKQYEDWLRMQALKAAATALSGSSTPPTGEDITDLAEKLKKYLDVRSVDEKNHIMPRSPGEIRRP